MQRSPPCCEMRTYRIRRKRAQLRRMTKANDPMKGGLQLRHHPLPQVRFIMAWSVGQEPPLFDNVAGNMASLAQSCPYCSKVFGAESQRSKSTHVGICRSKQLRVRETESKRRADEEEIAGSKRRRLHPPAELVSADSLLAPDSFDPATLGIADAALLRLYLTRRDLSSSLIDDILPLCALGSAPRFSSATAFFSFVDALPGPSFRVSRIALPDVPSMVFEFAYRPTLAVVGDMLSRFNGAFLDPAEEMDIERGPEFVDGTRFRDLQQQLTEAAGADAVLLPIIFSSGVFPALHACLDVDLLGWFPTPEHWRLTSDVQIRQAWQSSMLVKKTAKRTRCTSQSVRSCLHLGVALGFLT